MWLQGPDCNGAFNLRGHAMTIKVLQVGALALVGMLLAGCPYHPGRHGPRPRLPVVVQPVDTMQQAKERQRGQQHEGVFPAESLWVAA
jgi:hypothetical protein